MLCHLSNERFVILSYSTDSSHALKSVLIFSLSLSLTWTRNPRCSCTLSSGLPGRWAQLARTAALALWSGMGACQTAQQRGWVSISPYCLGKRFCFTYWARCKCHLACTWPCSWVTCRVWVQRYPGLGMCGWIKSMIFGESHLRYSSEILWTLVTQSFNFRVQQIPPAKMHVHVSSGRGCFEWDNSAGAKLLSFGSSPVNTRFVRDPAQLLARTDANKVYLLLK